MTSTPIFDALFVEHTIATLTADYWQAASGHDCATCADCIHDGHKCCGCYDGVCCQERDV